MRKVINITKVCSEIFAGGDAPKARMSKMPSEEYPIPIYSNGEENEGLYGYTDIPRVSQPSITISARGTIGYAAIRHTPFVPIVRLITLVPNSELINIKYLYYAVQNYQFDGSGTSIPQLTVPMLKKYAFPVCSLEEQAEIVATLENVDNLIALQKQQLQKLDELVKSRFIELFGDPTTNPMGHPIKALHEVAEYFNGLTYKPENVSATGTVVLRSSNIQNSELDFEDTVRVDCPIRDKLWVKENDILMCSRNGSARLVGKVALIKGLAEPMSFGAFMMIIRSPYYQYLMTFFQMDAFRQQIKTGATTTINQITGRMLDDVMLPIPDMEAVAVFSAFVEQTDKLKLEVRRSLDKLETLQKSLMQEYFG